VLQDLLLWSTAEFDYVRFGDGFVQSSSIMPQKRNPVGIEHARAIASKAVGEAQAIATVVHNTPFGDIVDTEDDLQPLVATMFHDAARAVRLVAAAIATASFDAARLEARAGEGWTTLTELADTLVRDHGVPFRTAHAISARLIAAHAKNPATPLAALVAEISSALADERIEASPQSIAEALSARHFVSIRRTHGGPAPEETARAIAESRQHAAADRAWWRQATDALADASRRLAERSAAL
jgi:argininosuccinate lyase